MSSPLRNWDQYSAKWAGLHGGVDPRHGSTYMRAWLRTGYLLGRVLVRLGVSPIAVTGTGLLLCALVPVTAAQRGGWPLFAAVLVLLAALADTVDGAVAIISNRVTRLGYLYDSVADRLGEACWLIAFWLLGVPMYVVVACGALVWLHEYIRARATAAGMSEIGVLSVAERPTRVIMVMIGLGLGGLGGLITSSLTAGIVTVVTVIWIVLGLMGLFQLLSTIRGTFGGGVLLADPDPQPEPEPETEKLNFPFP